MVNFALRDTHVWGMALAWVLFAPIGMMTAYLMKNSKIPDLLGKKFWFGIHVGSMIFTMIFTFIAVMTIAALRNWVFVQSVSGYTAGY